MKEGREKVGGWGEKRKKIGRDLLKLSLIT
jgi:hypothetical protein